MLWLIFLLIFGVALTQIPLLVRQKTILDNQKAIVQNQKILASVLIKELKNISQS